VSRNGIVIGSVELQGNGFVAYNISGAVIGKFQFAYGRTPRPADAATMTLTTALMVLALFVVMRGCCGCKNNFRSSFIPASALLLPNGLSARAWGTAHILLME